jgi:UDP-glucuronate 4-epimerase
VDVMIFQMNASFRVLLTGGAGFIGSHVAEALLREGTELTIIDKLDEFYSPARKRSNLAEIRRLGSYSFEEIDICDFKALREAVQRARPDAIVHLAARAGVRPSIEEPRLYENVNVAGTVNLLEVCREFQVKKVVFGSSSSVYGATSHSPFSEDQVELRPISPYAATKLAGEMLCYTYAHLFELPVVCLRFFTVYGPRQRPDLAIHKFTMLIVLASMRLELRPVAGEAPFEVFNLGNSHPVKLSELVDLLEVATGRRAIRQRRPLQPGDVPLTWADVSKAGRMLGYRPSTRIDEGLKRFVAWYRAAVTCRT